MDLFTAGYRKTSIRREILGFEGVVIDVRYNPWVKDKRWHQKNLQTLFGERYLHLPQLGNRLYYTSKIEIVNLQSGIKDVVSILEVADVLLLCCCKDIEFCHRKVISDEIERVYGIKTEHL